MLTFGKRIFERKERREVGLRGEMKLVLDAAATFYITIPLSLRRTESNSIAQCFKRMFKIIQTDTRDCTHVRVGCSRV